MAVLIVFRGDAMMRNTPAASGATLCLCLVACVNGCASRSGWTAPVGATEGPPIGIYRSTLVQCAGPHDAYQQQDGSETYRYGPCTVHLVAGYVQRLEGTCTRIAHCR